MIYRMRNYKYSMLSVVLGIVCIIAVVVVNQKIASQYVLLDGKTKALFGLAEILEFSYKYYFIIPSLISLFFGLMAIRRKEKRLMIQIAFFLGFLSIILIFVELWKLMI